MHLRGEGDILNLIVVATIAIKFSCIAACRLATRRGIYINCETYQINHNTQKHYYVINELLIEISMAPWPVYYKVE